MSPQAPLPVSSTTGGGSQDEGRGLLRRLLSPLVDLREGETTTAALMFAYSFLAMTAYNIVRPITRSKFIADLGADNLPWVQLSAGLLIGVIMTGYSQAAARISRRWVIPITQAVWIVLLLAFWLFFSAGYEWAPIAFYVLGLIFGLLLISQFWTLANDIYDARHAKRLFGFIGGGASLGGASGAAITASVVTRVGTVNLLLVSAFVLCLCLALVVFVIRRENKAGTSFAAVDARGVGGGEAIRLLRESRHLQLIAMIIGCAAMGGVIIEQQLNMAAAASLGEDADGITKFLAQVTVYLSLIGFLIQVTLTSRIHSMLGIGFALMILPLSLGATAVVMLFNAGLWAPAFARVTDTSLRYTVDKTTREILFLPLPTSVKYRAKPFIDVTMDRLAKAFGALTLLVLIKPWGLALSWQQLSFASLTLMAVWIVLAERGRREYLASFRRSLARRDVEADSITAPIADLQTIELLVEELSSPDERRVLYAIDLLESLEKRPLITPLLLHHSSPAVRARVLCALEGRPPAVAAQWLPMVERLLADADADVRAGAIRAISAIRGAGAAALLRQHLSAADPRMVATAAMALAPGPEPGDQALARAAFVALATDARDLAAPGRLEAARALGGVPAKVSAEILAPLLFDKNADVAREAIRSAGRLGPDSVLLVPPLVSLLRHRLLKNEARAVLVGYGESAIPPLAHFLQDEAEDLWVRRHVPATLASLPTQRTLDLLIDTLADRDGFIRYKAITAAEAVHRSKPELTVRHEPVESLAMAESLRHFNALTLHANLTRGESFGVNTLLVRALEEKLERSRERVFRLLGLLYAQSDMSAARYALEHGDGGQRTSAVEYLDNVLTGALRKRVLLMIDDMSIDERVRRTNLLFHTRRRTPEDTLAQLIHDDDQVIAACAIHLVVERGMWELSHDLEFAATHRDARDAYVPEAASWALAAAKAPAVDRNEHWRQPLPAVELASRLRRMPLFDYLSVDELFRFAKTGRQVRYEPGQVIHEEGVVPKTLQFLIDGDVRVGTEAAALPPGPLAFEPLLTGQPVPRAIHADGVAVTLSLTQDEFLTLLFDNVEVAHGLFRMVIESRRAGALRPVVRGLLPETMADRSEDGLQTMERALILRASPLLAGTTSDQVVRLAMVACEVRLTPGVALSTGVDERAIYLVVRGAISVAAAGAPEVVARPGDAVGLYETLANLRLDARLSVLEAGTALRLDAHALFDVLVTDGELLQALFGAVLRLGDTAALESAVPQASVASPAVLATVAVRG